MLLLGFPQEVAKKGTKGPNALWKPRARKVVPLSLHSFFRESKHLQLLRLQVKETCKHERRTQVKQQKFLPSATRPGLTNFFTKTISLPLPAARGGYMASDVSKDYMSFSLARFEERRGMKWKTIACLQ
jgi:hypothetical protein